MHTRKTSLEILRKFNRSVAPLLSRDAPSVHLLQESFLSDSQDWSGADLVFANSTCFPDELIADIEVKCRDLRAGSRVITFTTSLRSEHFKVQALPPPPPPALSSPPHTDLSIHVNVESADYIQEASVHVVGTCHCLHT